MTRRFKTPGFSAARQIGFARLFARSPWRCCCLLILAYHGVSLGDEHEWDPYLLISPASFERRLELLQHAGCTVLPLTEAIERLYRGDLPERAVCLTFDDGYYDFFARVQPRLRQYRFPATVYLNTLRCEHNLPLVRIGLSYVLWKSRRTQIDGTGVPGLENRVYTFTTSEERTKVATTIHDSLIARDAEQAELDAVLRDVSGRVGVSYDTLVSERQLTLMRPEEVSALAAEGVDFQLHTHRHANPVDPAKFLHEIRDNSWRIAAMTGRRPTHFCYPSGIYRQLDFSILESEGVTSATTTEPGIVSATEPRLLLPRFVDMNVVSDAEFACWLSGLAPWLRVAFKPSARS